MRRLPIGQDAQRLLTLPMVGKEKNQKEVRCPCWQNACSGRYVQKRISLGTLQQFTI